MENLWPAIQLTNKLQVTNMKKTSPTMNYLFPSNLGEKLFFITKQYAFHLYSSVPFIILEYNLMRCRIDIGPGNLQRATSCFSLPRAEIFEG